MKAKDVLKSSAIAFMVVALLVTAIPLAHLHAGGEAAVAGSGEGLTNEDWQTLVDELELATNVPPGAKLEDFRTLLEQPVMLDGYPVLYGHLVLTSLNEADFIEAIWNRDYEQQWDAFNELLEVKKGWAMTVTMASLMLAHGLLTGFVPVLAATSLMTAYHIGTALAITGFLTEMLIYDHLHWYLALRKMDYNHAQAWGFISLVGLVPTDKQAEVEARWRDYADTWLDFLPEYGNTDIGAEVRQDWRETLNEEVLDLFKPFARFSRSPDGPCYPGDTLQFDASASTAAEGQDLAEEPFRWVIRDPDGQWHSLTWRSSPSLEWTFESPGRHFVELEVRDVEGRANRAISSITIQNPVKPILRFRLDPEEDPLPPNETDFPSAPLTVYLDGSASYIEPSFGTIGHVEWDLGDGTVISGSLEEVGEIVHTYEDRGYFWLTLTLCGNGYSSSVSRPVMIWGDVIWVPDDYPKIQAAVYAARPYDTIVVRDGTYNENINVNRDYLTLQSENGAASTIIEAPDPDDYALNVTASHVSVAGFTVQGDILFDRRSKNNTVSECRIDGSIDMAWYASYNTVRNNKIHGQRITLGGGRNHILNNAMVFYDPDGWQSSTGILIFTGSNVITNNFIERDLSDEHAILDWTGIRLSGARGNFIADNVIANFPHALTLTSRSNNNIVLNNSFIGTGVFEGFLNPGMHISDSYDNTIEDNLTGGKPVLYLENVYNETIEGTALGQVILVNCDRITVRGLRILGTNDGITLLRTTNSVIEHNTISGEPLVRQASRHGYIFAPWTRGIRLEDSTDNTLFGNRLLRLEAGMSLRSSHRNEIHQNLMENTGWGPGYGIGLLASSNNSIYLNYVERCYDTISLSGSSSDNNIYLNSFSNSPAPRVRDSTNVWNSPEQLTYTYNGTSYTDYLGNFWDSYTGSDADGDGIGDTPYSIDEDNKDHYPLIEPDHSYWLREPRTWIVDDSDPADFNVIQEAVYTARPWDTIIVRAGTYTDTVRVDRPHLTLESEDGAEVTIVQAAHPYEPVFRVAADNVSISGFTVEGSGPESRQEGIALTRAEQCEISDNIVTNTSTGIEVGYSHNNLVMRNTARENRDGIVLFGSSNSTLTNNTVTSNDRQGIRVWYSDNNLIYLNSFVDNARNVYSLESTNVWNSPEETPYIYNDIIYASYLGNYWHDYTGSDADGDGIGDTPYQSRDNYPLMQPFENYEVMTELIVVTVELRDGQVGVAYEATLDAAGGTEPYTWAIVDGALPDDLQLNTESGVISGIPTEGGTFEFTMQVADAEDSMAERDLSITVLEEIPAYDLTMLSDPVEGGMAIDLTGESPYLEGAEVSIQAVPEEGYMFVGWTATAGEFDDATAETATFTMPCEAATATAHFMSLSTIIELEDLTDPETGEIEEEITFVSPDGMLAGIILEGTIAQDIDGYQLLTVTIAVNPDPPAAPEEAHIIGLTYDFGPDGATFAPPLIATITYDPDEVADSGVAPEDLVIAYYDKAMEEWLPLTSVVDVETNTITVEVAHFTTFAIIATPAPALEAALVDFAPDVLNLRAQGRWVTVYIELPEEYDVEDIDIDTVQLVYYDNELHAEWGDVQNGVLTVKFDWPTVAGWFTGLHDEEVEIAISGEVGEIQFEGTDTIRIIDPSQRRGGR